MREIHLFGKHWRALEEAPAFDEKRCQGFTGWETRQSFVRMQESNLNHAGRILSSYVSHTKRSPFRCTASTRRRRWTYHPHSRSGIPAKTRSPLSAERRLKRSSTPNPAGSVACTFIEFRAPCTIPPQIFGLWPPPVLYIQRGFRRQCFCPIETEQLNGRKSIPALSIIYTNTRAP